VADAGGASTPGNGAVVTRAPALTAALDAFFAWFYATWPVHATFIGVHDYDDRLPDLSAEGLAAAREAVDGLLAQFRRLPPEPTTEAEALDRRLVEGFLEVQRWEYGAAHGPCGNPCLYTGEAVFGVMGLCLRPFAPVAQRVQGATARLQAVPVLLAQAEAALAGVPHPWAVRALRECRGARVFFAHGLRTFAREHQVDDAALSEAAAAAVAAVRRFEAFLQAVPRREPGACACGAEALEMIVRSAHALDLSLDGIVALGEARLAEAQATLDRQARALGLASWQEALGTLADRHPPLARYYARYAELWDAARAVAVARGLVTWPDYPIRYVPQPRWVREAAPDLYFLPYRAPAAFDTVPVVEYFVPPIEPEMPDDERERRLRAVNDAVIKLNHVVHHGGLGHHVQNWYAYHRAASRVGRIAAVDCASRIAMLAGGTLAEGWACYATDLMDEVGFFDPLERVAYVQGRARIAARAVADVRLHRGEWTLEDVARWYAQQVGMTDDAAWAEAVKNSLHPGAALMYLVGTETIHALRRELASRQGFRLRTFHDRLLSYGSVPTALIASAMRATFPGGGADARGREGARWRGEAGDALP
jgi:uncharacterized protein (DUF885 family)